MNRLAASVRCDVRLQVRNGFYWAVAFVLCIFAILIGRLPEFDWAPVLPPLVLGNLAMATFYFIAGLVLLEKGEGTLEAQVVTPLRPREYLISKLATLTGLSVVENLLIAVLAHGTRFHWPAMILGIVMASALYCLLGFVVVSRYDGVNEFLFPSMLWTTLVMLPVLHYIGLWPGGWMYLHPFQAPLVMLKAAFFPIETWQWVYALGYSALWVWVGFAWSRRSFRRFVAASAGGASR